MNASWAELPKSSNQGTDGPKEIGDQMEGGPGFDLQPILDKNKRGATRSLVLFILLLVIVLGGGGTWLLIRANESSRRADRSRAITSEPLRTKVNEIERVVEAWKVPRPVKDWYLEQIRTGPYVDVLRESTDNRCPAYEMLPYHGEDGRLLYAFGILPDCTPTIVPNERPPP